MNSNHLGDSSITSIAELLMNGGLAQLGEVIKTLLNEVMKLERAEAIRALPYQRTEERQGYANGFKPKTVATRVGEVTLSVPQVRGMEFYPKSLEKGLRSERALKLAIAEMYVNGVSTRKVAEITKELCGLEVTSTQVSRCAALLDGELENFRERPLGAYPYVMLDARYEKVRDNGQVISAAVLIATGINHSGVREVLGVSVAISEAEAHWRTFLQSLVRRGLNGIRLIVSDDHTGLKAARAAVFSGVPWQRCQFHFAQNAQAYAPTRASREDIASAVKSIFAKTTLDEARTQVNNIADNFSSIAPRFVTWLQDNVEECFTVYSQPEPNRKKLRTINGVERTNREIKRRTRVVTIFPNTESLLRLVSAQLAEIHDEWASSTKVYLKYAPLQETRS